MNAALHRSFVVLSLGMALSLASDPQAVLSQELLPRVESPRRTGDTSRDPINPKVLEFLAPIEPAAGDDELVQKMKERNNLAVKLLESRIGDYKGNLCTLEEVFDAARLVIDAKVDLAPDRDAQLAVYESAREVALMIEQHFQKLRAAGLGKASDLQRAQLARLGVEVQILKLQRQP